MAVMLSWPVNKAVVEAAAVAAALAEAPQTVQ
jgi:hypothetical protein